MTRAKKGGWVYVIPLMPYNQADPNVKLGNVKADQQDVDDEEPKRMSRAVAEILISRGKARKAEGRVEAPDTEEKRPSHAPEVSAELSDLIPKEAPTDENGEDLEPGDIDPETGEEIPDQDGTVESGW